MLRVVVRAWGFESNPTDCFSESGGVKRKASTGDKIYGLLQASLPPLPLNPLDHVQRAGFHAFGRL